MEELLKLIKDKIDKEELKDKITELIKSLCDTENVDMTKPVDNMLNACEAKGDILDVGICLKVTLDGVKAQLAAGTTDLLDILLFANKIAPEKDVKSELKTDIKSTLDEIYKNIETLIDNIKGGIN